MTNNQLAYNAIKAQLFKKVSFLFDEYQYWKQFGEKTEDTIAAYEAFKVFYNFVCELGFEQEYLDWKYKGEITNVYRKNEHI